MLLELACFLDFCFGVFSSVKLVRVLQINKRTEFDMEVKIISCSKSFLMMYLMMVGRNIKQMVLLSLCSYLVADGMLFVYLLSVLLGFCCEWQIPIIERHEEFKLLI